MSIIAPFDVGSHYSYAAIASAEGLKAGVKPGEKQFPINCYKEARELLETIAKPERDARAYALWSLATDAQTRARQSSIDERISDYVEFMQKVETGNYTPTEPIVVEVQNFLKAVSKVGNDDYYTQRMGGKGAYTHS